MNAPTIIITTGGTGGHLFPAEATAAALIRRGARITVITDARGEDFTRRFPGAHVETIAAASPAGGLARKISAAWKLFQGAVQSRRIIRRLKPSAIIGFGGYASAPAMWVAQRLGIPSVLHEQNAYLGRANRVLAAGAERLALSFEQTESIPAALQEKAVLVGNPVRRAVTMAAGPYTPPAGDDPVRLVVFGGSQGASVFARVVPETLHSLPEELRARLHVTQQARPGEVEQVRDAYQQDGIRAEVATFFDDLPRSMATAHLVIARAGASTVAELAALGRPGVLVPYPHAADDHQTLNARAIVDAGAGWFMPEPKFTADALRHTIEALVEDPAALTRMAAAAAAQARTDAAERLADLVLQTGGAPLSSTPVSGSAAA